jgi:hypothetical protein
MLSRHESRILLKLENKEIENSKLLERKHVPPQKIIRESIAILTI